MILTDALQNLKFFVCNQYRSSFLGIISSIVGGLILPQLIDLSLDLGDFQSASYKLNETERNDVERLFNLLFYNASDRYNFKFKSGLEVHIRGVRFSAQFHWPFAAKLVKLHFRALNKKGFVKTCPDVHSLDYLDTFDAKFQLELFTWIYPNLRVIIVDNQRPMRLLSAAKLTRFIGAFSHITGLKFFKAGPDADGNSVATATIRHCSSLNLNTLVVVERPGLLKHVDLFALLSHRFEKLQIFHTNQADEETTIRIAKMIPDGGRYEFEFWNVFPSDGLKGFRCTITRNLECYRVLGEYLEDGLRRSVFDEIIYNLSPLRMYLVEIRIRCQASFSADNIRPDQNP